MYLIYNQSDKRQFLIAKNYDSAPIPADWDVRVCSGKSENRGELVATRSPNAGALALTSAERARRGL